MLQSKYAATFQCGYRPLLAGVIGRPPGVCRALSLAFFPGRLHLAGAAGRILPSGIEDDSGRIGRQVQFKHAVAAGLGRSIESRAGPGVSAAASIKNGASRILHLRNAPWEAGVDFYGNSCAFLYDSASVDIASFTALRLYHSMFIF